jgi:hypothetical protein
MISSSPLLRARPQNLPSCYPRLSSSLASLALLASPGSPTPAFSGAGYHVNFPNALNAAVDIQHFHTTLVVPKAPSPATDTLLVWPGIQTNGGDTGRIALVQSIAASFGAGPNPRGNGCNGQPGQCYAFTYEYVKGSSVGGPTYTVEPGAHLGEDMWELPAGNEF